MKVYWHECGHKHGNFGDKLTPVLLDYFGVTCEWSPPERAELIGIGSLLHKIPLRFSGIVWSTGALYGDERPDLSKARVLALRGKLTRSQVANHVAATVCLGDGGLLASIFFRPCRKRFKVGVIPHYAQAGNRLFEDLKHDIDIALIDICDEPRSVIQKIGQCEHILSSSLHGLIVADSLGIPNRWIDVCDGSAKILGGGFKFRDYYSNFDFGDLDPTILQNGVTLDRLLPLFEEYRRPRIDDYKEKLLESIRSVVEPRSCYRWERAKHDIVHREELINERLEHQGRQPCGNVTSLDRDADANGIVTPVPLDAARDQLASDSRWLTNFLSDCLSQIQKLHDIGIAHGDIREANVLVYDRKPIFANLGWCLPSDDSDAIPAERLINADLRALGKLMHDLAGDNPNVAVMASLLMQSQADQPIGNGATARTLVQLLLVSKDGLHDGLLQKEELEPMALDQLSLAAKALLKIVADRDGEITSLRAELESLKARQWRTEVKAVALQLAQVIAADESYVLIDQDEWRNEFTTLPKSFPFVERNGDYWGPPADDEEAIRELKRLQRLGANYVVVGKPAFWWLEYYSGLRQYLNASAECIYDDELLIVYDLSNSFDLPADVCGT